MPTGQVVERGSENPLPDVVVSDGLAVTRTQSDGSFSFPARDDAEFVFLTAPSSHRALQSGWFAPVRDGAASSLRLELEQRPEGVADGCTFAQVTDLHVSVDEGARLRPMIEAGIVSPPGIHMTGETSAAHLRADLELVVDRARPDFIAATGDLADYGQPEELEAYRGAITGLAVPVASVPGNHDHLSVLNRTAIDAFFSTWRPEDTPGLDAGAAFQRAVFGGDWRRPDSGRSPWRDVIGPLYFSFDWGGVHFVAYDGEGLRRYGQDYPQDEWLVNDLREVAPDTPVVVLTHFPESQEFYRSRFSGVRLVASVSGHWHGTRVWHDGEAHHWTSSTIGFGGIDHTPRGYRVFEVDQHGARSRWETVEAPSPPAPVVSGAGAVVGGRVTVAFAAPDASGAVTALGHWTHELPSAARGGVTAADGTVFALDLNSRVLALDASTGDLRWSHLIGDGSIRWCLGAPRVQDGVVYAGSAMGVCALDATDGRVLWCTELEQDDWAASWSGVAVDGDTVVIGAANDHLHLAALDAATGAVRWRHAGRDISGVSVTPVIVGDQVFAARGPGWLVAYAVDDGTLQWEAPLDDAWPVALVVDDGVAVVRSATGTVSAHDVSDGSMRWSCMLGPCERAARPYSRAPGGARCNLLLADGQVWTAAGTELVGIDLGTGQVTKRIDAGGEVATVIGDGDEALAVTVDAQVVRSGD